LELPELTVDMDGVLCRPILWFNLVISRDVRRPPEIPAAALRRRPPLHHRVAETHLGQTLRYSWRPPMPDVREGLAALADLRRLVLLSGRPESARSATELWLKRHSLADYFSEVVLNDRHLPNAAFKLATARERNVREHIDDDGRVAFFLAQDAPRKVYLISWRANAGLPYPPTVQRVRSVLQVAALIREGQPRPEE
jgi:hypothetical protein